VIGTVYVEREVAAHPRTEAILRRLPGSLVIPIERYGEVFNRRNQSFRLQKSSPSLILAAKHSGHVLAAPPGYGLPSYRNLYFSHMLNCLYDCRYCFLQGMFRSASYVLFVNYEDFEAALDEQIAVPGAPPFFFSGFDCDSLAFEGVTGFAESFVDFFARRPDAWLELRTKSASVDVLLEREPLERTVVAWSLSPDAVARSLEHGAPTLASRLTAMEKVAERGWKLGLRFDPLIYHEGYEASYAELFRQVFERLPAASLHSVSLGLFRLPAPFMRDLLRQRPGEPFLAAPLEEAQGVVSLRSDLAERMREVCSREVLGFVPEEIFFPCFSGEVEVSS
jgi:spore photoproduct lyase